MNVHVHQYAHEMWLRMPSDHAHAHTTERQSTISPNTSRRQPVPPVVTMRELEHKQSRQAR